MVVDITMSLDGYVTAAGADLAHGLGVGGEPLHNWAMGDTRSPQDIELLETVNARTGAVIMGRNTFDVVDGPHGWDDRVGYGGERDQSASPPVFVVTRRPRPKIRLAGRFTIVTDGLHSALDQARAAAGDKDVVIMGGGAVCHAYLAAGLVDVLSIHLAPMVLGDGTRLFPAEVSASFRLEQLAVVSTPAANHLTYRVLNN